MHSDSQNQKTENRAGRRNVSLKRDSKNSPYGSRRLKLLTLLLIAMLILTQTGCSANTQSANSWTGYSKTNFCLDTVCDITIYGVADYSAADEDATAEEQQKLALSLIDDAYAVVRDYEKLLSKTIEGSDVYRINHAGGQPIAVSADTIEVLEKGLSYCELSEGLFDITVGKATELWNFGSSMEESAESAVVPSEKELADAVKHVDYTKVLIDRDEMTVQLTDPEMELDLGGIAKGYIADKAAQYLLEHGAVSAIVNLGGNIEAVGGKSTCFSVPIEVEPAYSSKAEPDPEAMGDFVLGIKNPLSETGELLGILPSRDKTIVTSGTYERCFEKDGVKYHHILDPKTGYPIDTDLIQVSIIGKAGMSCDCDGLSTACLAMGVEKGLELIRSIEDVEAVFIDKDGNVTMSGEDFGFELNTRK